MLKLDASVLSLNTAELPAYAQEKLAPFWQAINESLGYDASVELQQQLNPEWYSVLGRAIFFSQYLQKTFLANPRLLFKLAELPPLDEPLPYKSFNALFDELTQWQDEQVFQQQLRQIRQLYQSRFIIQHYLSALPIQALMKELSDFAEAAIIATVNWHHRQLVARFGEPYDFNKQEKQSLIVLGMGKLGGGELNLSSDVDLVFLFDKAGETLTSPAVENQVFFSTLGQSVIKTLNHITEEGFVFRVDMRLRPFGQSGLLVSSNHAFSRYLQDQGRDWERYAYIKARVLGSDVVSSKVYQLLNPFVYRRYTDFSVLDNLREMKQLINKEVNRQGKVQDVKLSAGGIREVEFIVQALQLVYGGRYLICQTQKLKEALDQLTRLGLVATDAATQLYSAYVFLRRVEHGLQAMRDEQTHQLPTDEIEQKCLALSLGFDDFAELEEVLGEYQASVRNQFDHLLGEDAPRNPLEVVPFKLSKAKVSTLTEWMNQAHWEEDAQNKVIQFLSAKKVQHLKSTEWVRLKRSLQLILPKFADKELRDTLLSPMIRLLGAVCQRSMYLVLLYENPQTIDRLFIVAKASPWVMNQFIQWPALLEELLAEHPFSLTSSKSAIADRLRQQSLRIPLDDLSEQMDLLRYFKMAHVIPIVLADVTGELIVFSVSQYLTDLAEVILEYILDLVWHQLTKKHGFPTADSKPLSNMPFAILAYGKVGGQELGYNSDLDLVFLYEAPLMEQTDGAIPVSNSVFFTRLAQRVIHVISTRTTMSLLYEVDVRLRPSGNKGLLVSSIEAFERYQTNEAWVWEQQAIVRARVIAGSPDIKVGFNRFRAQLLAQSRDKSIVAREVAAMREKMLESITPAYAKKENSEIFDVKHSRWGIIDIEFLVQYAVLAFGHQFEALVRFTDNLRLLEVMADAGLITDEQRAQLVDAYRAYREWTHSRALKQEKNEIDTHQVDVYRSHVKAVWQQLIDSEIKN
ncbi:MAG: bifunctional [glutamate--ammonia ligase]-adenylyl-L-tyrosine phosphorylase/[glutamate--ammonia-ligase] adenylyltransferase [Cellvibrionales bacterium]|nr:bifunctional [glutamate--ammonia ligase]-adenylyl-L-tyrosine phosphorylase/[glutamate--ammonia-ligase] adenylyltransferase [Cellvibrionales bacterium]